MKLEINVISRDTIPPSSPTPDNLNIYKLSYLDQMHLPVFIARVLFYPANDTIHHLTTSEKSNQLKKSLSHVLTLFYPLAGRFAAGNTCVSCNDEGVAFVEAHANGKLWDHVINDPIPSEFTKFLPYKDDELKDHPLVIQATFFDCGGLALGVGISHRIADAWSFFMFVNSWAGTSLGNNNNIVSPSFNCTTLFPPNDSVSFKSSYWDVNEENIITKRFVFSASNLSALKDKYTIRSRKTGDAAGNSRTPTRIEAISAFIWDRFMASTTKIDDPTKIYIIKHTINLRGKVIPTLPDNSFGNVMWASNAIVSTDGGAGGGDITTTEKIREAIQNVGGDKETTLRELNESMKSIKNGEGELMQKGQEEVVPLVFSSTCRFPIDKSDFGWGKPVWVGSANLPHRNVIYLLDSLSGKGIEAWINLKSEDMVKFEVDEELLQYVSFGHDANVVW